MIVKDKRVYKATDEERKEILNIQKETLQYLNYNNMYELMQNKKDFKEFNNIINKEMGYNYYYAYDIIVGDEAIEIEYNNVFKSNMNKLIIDKTNKMFDNNYYISFENDYKTLIDLLINIDNEVKADILHSDLKHKRIQNINDYNEGLETATIKYTQEIKKLENTYLDL